jgi:hypothetical protein
LKRKPTDRKKLENQLDKLFSQAVIARDRKCKVSGSDDRLTVHHIRSRSHKITRWNLENGICLSWKVHFLQKANPELFMDKIIECIGQKEYDRLKKLSVMTYKWSLEELERIKEQLLEVIHQNE